MFVRKDAAASVMDRLSSPKTEDNHKHVLCVSSRSRWFPLVAQGFVSLWLCDTHSPTSELRTLTHQQTTQHLVPTNLK